MVIYIYRLIYNYTLQSGWIPKSNTKEPDCLQHGYSACCVIAQQYYSITFTILNFHFSKEKFNARSKIVIVSIHLIFLNFLSVTLRNLKLCLYFSLIQEILTTLFLPHYGPGVDLVSDRNGYQEYFLGGKCCRWPTTLPLWCADWFWKLHSPATLWEWTGLKRIVFPSPLNLVPFQKLSAGERSKTLPL
jgi:hypothetical protein